MFFWNVYPYIYSNHITGMSVEALKAVIRNMNQLLMTETSEHRTSVINIRYWCFGMIANVNRN